MQRGAGLLSKKILAALLSGGILLLPNWGYALPSGGTVVAGNITSGPLSPSGSQMDITGSGNVAINWNSFDIAQNETVNFKNMQAVLNYVSGGSRSEIYGNLKSDSGVHVFLVNPSGILFGKTAQVNVGQLTASTRRLEAGEMSGFDGSLAPLTAEKAAKVQADIINLGKLTAGKLVLEGNNLSIIGADSLDVADKSQITLRANENINIGYEVTDKTTIDVGDGAGNTHQVSDYTKGGGTKASSVLSGASVTDLTGGSKSINDAMLVHDVYELQAINKNVAGNYMLAADIDASDTQGQNDNYWFKPLGNLTVANTGVLLGGFTGIFDGAGHSIENLYVKRPSEKRIGLFDYIAQGGVVGNFNIGGYIEGESNFGSVAGYNQGTIYSVVNSAELVSKGAGIGGIVGTNGGLIRDTVNKGTLNIDGSSGGIAGSNGDTFLNNAGALVNVKNTGDVLSKITGGIGGIVGTNSKNGTITNAENAGAVKTLDNAGGELGGISGRNYGAIETATNTGNIAGHLYDDNKAGTTKIGGIVGQNYADAKVKEAENFGTVSGYYDVGGIAGVNAGTLDSVQNHQQAAVTAKLEAAGGISGTNSGTITQGANSAAVKANNLYVGGIVGDNKNGGKIDDVINEGTVDGKGFIGGIVGNNGDSEIKNAANFGTVTAGDGNNNGQSLAGGIAGYNGRNGSILSSYNQGSIHGNIAFVGGIAGQSVSTIKDCYNVGNVSGAQYVGGIAGYTTGLNSNVYNLGVISGTKNFGEIIGLNGAGTITNAYFATDTGFQKYGDGTEYDTVEAFNEAFLAGMQESDKALWLTYGDKTTPLLKGLLKPLDINIGDIEAEYTDSGYTGLAQAVADKLAEQGIIIDVDKLLADSKTEIGEYALSDLLYSTQDGYALNVTGKLIIKEKTVNPDPPVNPEQPVEPVVPASDAKYTGSLTHLKTEKMQQEEYRNLDKRRNKLLDYAAVVVDGDGIKLEETEE
ncbi:MAG: filamentous hemagglutinin N-terminal domain-containing protein [Phascolarctobacterium sp.]|uniref:filamentous hemagglutinin N-terminal domain-containing protein n=1 Tax=Phascolarctobacterium sp. TaxID=2049039 RepID=UPI0025F73FA3|nr:filamentous hemagglutinin N-terminal domain-containing protein [Phascolarctobacterium sp.]MCC8159279.1 filamentous hemagglutinin N-terminal domain-containing protein [Phascolarctobacterium sp.]